MQSSEWGGRQLGRVARQGALHHSAVSRCVSIDSNRESNVSLPGVFVLPGATHGSQADTSLVQDMLLSLLPSSEQIQFISKGSTYVSPRPMKLIHVLQMRR